MPSTIAKLRKTLPEFLTIEQYCALAGRCRASAFNDMRRVRRLAVKIGPHTRIVRDVMLDEMERAQTPVPWLPQKDRFMALAPSATPQQVTRTHSKASAPFRRERDSEVQS